MRGIDYSEYEYDSRCCNGKGCGKNPKKSQPVVLDGKHYIPNIFDLPKLGAGHDGIVFRYGDLALKLLKYDIETRKAKGLMTFQKAKFFSEELHMKRHVQPKGIMLNEDGVYCGYSMDALEDVTLDKKKGTLEYMQRGDFMVGELESAIADLEQDADELTRKKIVAKDLNRGSYIFTSHFMHICDMDKFMKVLSAKGVRDLNVQALNFLIAKFFLYEIQKMPDVTEADKKVVAQWVKRSISSKNFLDKTREEIACVPDATISQYLDIKKDMILKR